jgi:hypothetical protein
MIPWSQVIRYATVIPQTGLPQSGTEMKLNRNSNRKGTEEEKDRHMNRERQRDIVVATSPILPLWKTTGVVLIFYMYCGISNSRTAIQMLRKRVWIFRLKLDAIYTPPPQPLPYTTCIGTP